MSGRKEETIAAEIKVIDKDVEKALKTLKRQTQKDGLIKEIKKRSFYEKPSERKKRKRLEARRKQLKAMRRRPR